MKRSVERESSPRSKRSRNSGYPPLDHDGGRDRLSPDVDRRMDARGGGGRNMVKGMKPYRDFDQDMDPRGGGKYRDDRMSDQGYPQMGPRGGTPDYRSLCISNIVGKIPDHVLKETMYREFKKFGEFNVNITYTGDQRVAYINFRYPEDARAAKHQKSKMLVFDRPVRVESVYNKRRISPSREREGGAGGGRGGGDFFRHGSPPNNPGHNMRRGGGGPPPNMRYPNQNLPRDMPPRDRGGGGGGGGGDYNNQIYENRRGNEKFPHHLEHINPEDDEKATRTLFVGNLDYNIAEPELRRIFERYGPIEEIDIKRPQRGQGNAYAFIKYMNLDCAHRAKVEMSGTYIGRFQCKIGYGKVTPSTCLWVGGLGPWINHQTLEREFDRFGLIHRIEWPHGKNYAYVLYDSIDAATAAIQEMRGFPLGGQDRRLRVDFVDASHISASSNPSPRRSEDNFGDDRRGFDEPRDNWRGGHREPYEENGSRRRNDSWENRNDPVNAYRNPDNPRDDRPRVDVWDKGSDKHRHPRTPDEFGDRPRRVSRSPNRSYDGYRDREYDNRRRYSQDRDFPENEKDYRRGGGNYSDQKQGPSDGEIGLTDVAEGIHELAKCLPVAWNGALILKSSAFPARMHVLSGDVTIVDTLMRDPTTTETPVLHIKQRLRLDQSKLDDVGKRVNIAGPRGHCILMALPSTLQNYEDPSRSVQQRPLKNLVTYLKQKEAAGVITLPNYETKDKDNIGLLHAFPPCQFGYEYLLNRAPKLPPEPIQDDYLIIVVVRGAA